MRLQIPIPQPIVSCKYIGDTLTMKASECKCCLCGKQAVAFWPIIDPDIPSDAYCRECLDKTKMRMLIDTFKMTEGEAKMFVKEVGIH